MKPTKYIWINGRLIPWKKAQVHVLTHAMHYGSAAFEGTRVYKTPKGPAIFRLKDHTRRLFYSAKALRMKVPYSQKAFNEATLETVRKNKLQQGYIRPMFFYGYGKMGLNPVGAPLEAMIACWPWGKYLSDDPIKVHISDFIRIHPQSTVADAKISGHYVNSIMAVLQLQGTRFQEALLLDFKGNIAEGPGENFFLVKNGTVYTPPLGTILSGITRNTLFELAESMGIQIKEKILKPKDLEDADEAFFSGTAAEVTPIAAVDKVSFNKGKIGPITARLKDAYMGLVQGKNPAFEKYLAYVD